MDTNGKGPEQGLKHIADALREEMVAEQAKLHALMVQVQEHRDRIERAHKALAALEGPAPKKAKQSKAKAADPNYISEAMLEKAWEVMRYQAEPTTVKQLSELMEASDHTARKALEKLREQGLVRLAGKEKRGSMMAAVYLPMPEHANAS